MTRIHVALQRAVENLRPARLDLKVARSERVVLLVTGIASHPLAPEQALEQRQI